MVRHNVKKVQIFALAALLCTEYAAMGIQKSTAWFGTALAGGASAFGGYYFSAVEKSMRPDVAAAIGVLFTGLAYYQLDKITPQGRLKRANTMLKELSRHSLVGNELVSDKDYFDCVHDVYLTEDLPLISAYNYLISVLPTVHSALGLINKASAQAYENELKQECDYSLSYANKLFNNVSFGLKRIREHKDYLEQLRIYKQYLTEQRQLEVNQQMATAQSQMASAQKSATFLKWIKALFLGK